MKDFQSQWAESVINNRVIVIAFSFLLLVFSIFLIIKFPLKYDNSFEMFMLKDDPNIEKFENFRDLFGDAEYLSVGIEAPISDQDLFSAKTIRIIHEISTMLEDHVHVTKVSSLSKYQYTRHLNGSMITEDLFKDASALEDGSSDLLYARNLIRAEPLAINTIISQDLRHTRILARTEYVRNENKHKIKISNDIYRFLNENNYLSQGYHIRLAGSAIIAERFDTLSKRDSAILNPSVAVIMCVILWFVYSSISACILPWFLIGTSIGIVGGLQAAFNIPITVVNGALVPTLMIIGMGVSVHILSEFHSLRLNGASPTEASKTTIRNLLKPIFFTALTTSTGFGALSVTDLVPVRQYALLAASGSLIIFLISMTLFVSVLSFISVAPNKKKMSLLNQIVSRLTSTLALFSFKNKKIIVFICSLCVIFCVVTLPKISVDSNIFNYFKSNNWINHDMEYFDQIYKFGGLELVIDSEMIDGIKDPTFLKRVQSLETYLNKFERTGKVTSVIELLKRLRQSLNGDNQDYFILPDTSDMTAQLLLMYANSGANNDLSDSIDFDNRFLRLTVPIENSSANQFAAFYYHMRNQVKVKYPNLNIYYTGPMVLYNAQETYINSGLKQSFSFALLMIALSFFVLFKSLKYGFIALFPSVLPILIVGGATVLMGLSLDLGTVIVGAMCMGIAVDDAIHVMARYIDYKEQKFTTKQSIDQAVKESGKAVILTSLILVFGFSMMLFASLIPTILLGVFVSLIMALALLGDLLVLPALLHLLDNEK